LALYIKNDPLRPYELAKKQIEEERRKLVSEADKRKVIEDRIEKELKLRRDEDVQILKEMKGSKTYTRHEGQINVQKFIIESELQNLFGDTTTSLGE